MKNDIHPDYVETQVTCTCGATFTTRSTVATGHDPLRRLLAVPPLLHRQAEDPRHRRPRRPLRGPLRQGRRRPSRQQVVPLRAPVPAHAGAGARRFVTSTTPTGRGRHSGVRGRRGARRRARATSSTSSARPRPTPTRAWPSSSTSATPSSAAILAAWRELDGLADDLEAARELAGEDASFAEEADALLERAAAPAEERLRRLLVPARPGRRQGRAARDQVRRGRRGVGAVRRRPAADVHPLRRAARLAHRDPRRHRVRPRRLQVGHGGGQGQGHPRARARRRSRC